MFKMKIVNPGPEDFHIHSLNFSDGFNTIDEIVKFAGEIGLKKIAITDHSQAAIDKDGLARKTYRSIIKRWKNVHNDVEVVFGVEADLLNEKGDICDEIQGIKGNFIILSAHKNVYSGDVTKITEAYVNAIRRFHKNIDAIGHPYSKDFAEHIDIVKIAEAANEFGIPMELNAMQLIGGKADLKLLNKMLEISNQIIVNSDAHVLCELKEAREAAFKYLKEKGLIE